MSENEVLASDHPLGADERLALQRLVGLIIPASAEYDLPGADDPAIFGDLWRSAARAAETVRVTLRRLDELAGGAFRELPETEQWAAAERLRDTEPLLAGAVSALAAQCYYRDDRVMGSLGMELRPPFPQGFELSQGDWSLLDPVRARPRLYRDAP